LKLRALYFRLAFPVSASCWNSPNRSSYRPKLHIDAFPAMFRTHGIASLIHESCAPRCCCIDPSWEGRVDIRCRTRQNSNHETERKTYCHELQEVSLASTTLIGMSDMPLAQLIANELTSKVESWNRTRVPNARFPFPTHPSCKVDFLKQCKLAYKRLSFLIRDLPVISTVRPGRRIAWRGDVAIILSTGNCCQSCNGCNGSEPHSQSCVDVN